MSRLPVPALEPAAPTWVLPEPVDAEAAAALAQSLKLPPALGRVLVARAITDEAGARRHLRPRIEHLHDPRSLAGIDDALDRIERAIADGETILVHGDYDVDGVCATALLTDWLRRFGARVEPFVPHRLRDGYDFGDAGIARAHEVGATLAVTVDCGTVAHEAVRRASATGLDVIVTDHHTPGPELPRAVAVVNPQRADCGYPERSLCGTGVAFKLVQALAARRDVALDALLPDLDLVALATIADLVPLAGENRTLVRFGLRALERTRRPGLAALLDTSGLGRDRLESGRVGFVLAPRINAVGRLGDAGDALRLLLSADEAEARRLALGAEETNRARQDEDRRTLDEALEELERTFDPSRDYGVVLAREGWHPGVIGIVASRIVERIHRPVVLVALNGDRGRGSARSIPGFHLYDAIHACADRLDRFGGHRQAAGMDLAADAVEPFRDAFNREAGRRLEGVELRPSLRIDLELSLAEADLPLADLFAYLGPHGIGNPRPVFVARDLTVRGRPRVVGQGHLKVDLEQGGALVPAIGFGLAERLPPERLEGARVDAVFQLTANEFRGRRSAQLRLLDLRTRDDA